MRLQPGPSYPKGVAVKRFSLSLLALGLLAIVTSDLWSHPTGTSRRNSRCFSPEEKRLNRFWHDYYDSMRAYYHNVSRIDWVAYYKNHSCPNSHPLCNGQCIIQHSPVVVVPGMQYLQPNYPPFQCAGQCGP
jgi:hypothetical protein